MSASLEWTRLFVAEGPRLLRFLRRFEPAVSAEDIAQDSFAKLCAVEPQTIASPRAFLFRTARNLAIDQVRRGRASPVRTVEDLAALASLEPLPSPEDERILAENREALAAAMALLSAEQRAALLLRRIEGLSSDEVASRLGVSVRQVQRLIVQALSQAQAHIRSARDTSDALS